MPYHYLGNTGLKVSAICLGTMTFAQESSPDAMPSTDKAEAFKMLDLFAESGGNFIDTADMYSGGQSEMVGTSSGPMSRMKLSLDSSVRSSPTGSPNFDT
jgi:aryl-alcohol dehydrogenase-like predicted oxidoreductase